MLRCRRFASLICLLAASQAVHGQSSPCSKQGNEPLSVEGNAAIVTLEFKRPDGTMRSARFAFDSGGGAIIIDAPLAADLGLQPSGKEVISDGQRYVATTPPAAQIGSLPVTLSSSKAFIHLGTRSFDTRERIEGLLPGKALEPYQVVLDYPGQKFSIAVAGCIEHRGSPVPSPFLPDSGHPRVIISMQGKTYGLLLDTGTRVTLARRDLLEALSINHPEWPKSKGAAGAANMRGDDGNELLLRVPEVTWGKFQIKNVLIVSRPDAIYNSSSYETPEPIVGALGGNVLKNFRVEIDYPHGTTYLEQSADLADGDMNSVGLVLDVDPAGALVVRAISTTAAARTKANIQAGDQIIEIDGNRETPWTIVDASQALCGAIGETKTILLRRNGTEIRTTGVVAHLL